MSEPCHDIAHLAHVDLLTDKFEESLDFFTRIYGLSVSSQSDGVAYLRGFDDYEFHSLKLTAADTTGIGPRRPSCNIARGAGAACRRQFPHPRDPRHRTSNDCFDPKRT